MNGVYTLTEERLRKSFNLGGVVCQMLGQQAYLAMAHMDVSTGGVRISLGDRLIQNVATQSDFPARAYSKLSDMMLEKTNGIMYGKTRTGRITGAAREDSILASTVGLSLEENLLISMLALARVRVEIQPFSIRHYRASAIAAAKAARKADVELPNHRPGHEFVTAKRVETRHLFSGYYIREYAFSPGKTDGDIDLDLICTLANPILLYLANAFSASVETYPSPEVHGRIVIPIMRRTLTVNIRQSAPPPVQVKEAATAAI